MLQRARAAGCSAGSGWECARGNRCSLSSCCCSCRSPELLCEWDVKVLLPVVLLRLPPPCAWPPPAPWSSHVVVFGPPCVCLGLGECLLPPWWWCLGVPESLSAPAAPPARGRWDTIERAPAPSHSRLVGIRSKDKRRCARGELTGLSTAQQAGSAASPLLLPPSKPSVEGGARAEQRAAVSTRWTTSSSTTAMTPCAGFRPWVSSGRRAPSWRACVHGAPEAGMSHAHVCR